MLQLLYVVLSKQSCDSLTDLGETASVEHLSEAGHLQNTIGLCNEEDERDNKRFILFISLAAW